MTQPDVTAQEQYDVASWRVANRPRIYFPIVRLQSQIGNRIIQHKRPYRRGAKLDNTGPEPRQWSLQVIFRNGLTESDLDQNGADLFPDVYRAMEESFDEQETGDLVIPGLGNVRAKALSMSSEESPEETDQATCALVFLQDNEDSLDAALLRPPTARSTIRRLAEDTVFTNQAAGAWDGDLNGLIEFAAEVENLMLAPGRATQAVETQVRRNRRAIDRIAAAQQQLAKDVGLDFDKPRGSAAERRQAILKDRMAHAASERSAGRPSTITFRVDVAETTIFDVAARFDQDAAELMELNDARIADPFRILRGSSVLVYEVKPR